MPKSKFGYCQNCDDVTKIIEGKFGFCACGRQLDDLMSKHMLGLGEHRTSETRNENRCRSRSPKQGGYDYREREYKTYNDRDHSQMSRDRTEGSGSRITLAGYTEEAANRLLSGGGQEHEIEDKDTSLQDLVGQKRDSGHVGTNEYRLSKASQDKHIELQDKTPRGYSDGHRNQSEPSMIKRYDSRKDTRREPPIGPRSMLPPNFGPGNSSRGSYGGGFRGGFRGGVVRDGHMGMKNNPRHEHQKGEPSKTDADVSDQKSARDNNRESMAEYFYCFRHHESHPESRHPCKTKINWEIFENGLFWSEFIGAGDRLQAEIDLAVRNIQNPCLFMTVLFYHWSMVAPSLRNWIIERDRLLQIVISRFQKDPEVLRNPRILYDWRKLMERCNMMSYRAASTWVRLLLTSQDSAVLDNLANGKRAKDDRLRTQSLRIIWTSYNKGLDLGRSVSQDDVNGLVNKLNDTVDELTSARCIVKGECISRVRSLKNIQANEYIQKSFTACVNSVLVGVEKKNVFGIRLIEYPDLRSVFADLAS